MLFAVQPTPKFFKEMNHIVDDFFQNANPISQKKASVPSVNIKESEEKFELSLLAPGFEKEDFSIQSEKGVMNVKAEHRASSETKEDNFKHREFSINSIERKFYLPENANLEGIQATYTNGVLNIEIPKKVVEKPKPIEVKIA